MACVTYSDPDSDFELVNAVTSEYVELDILISKCEKNENYRHNNTEITKIFINLTSSDPVKLLNWLLGRRPISGFIYKLIGNYYDVGSVVDSKEALSWYGKAADLGNGHGAFNIGKNCFKGKGVDKNNMEAMKWFVKAGDLGYCQGYRRTGCMFKDGLIDGVKDYVKALGWFEKAAGLLDRHAIYEIACIYDNGLGIERNSEKALEYYFRAIDAGNSYAMVAMAQKYHFGEDISVGQDFKRAMDLYLKAAELNNSRAMVGLGTLFFNGNGVDKNYVFAMDWCRRAANLGNINAMNKIAKLYRSGLGLDNKQPDYISAYDWFTKAANLGSVSANRTIGDMYLDGSLGVNESVEALKWYTKGAYLGDKIAMTNIGNLLFEAGRKKGSQADYKEAYKWYMVGELDVRAVKNLATMFEFGFGYGVEKNVDKVLYYYLMGSDLGNSYCMFKAGKIYSDRKEYREGKNMFLKAAENGNSDAMYELGLYYEYGYGLPKSSIEALKWYTKSMEAKNPNGYYYAGIIHMNSGNDMESLKCLGKAFSLFPDDDQKKSNCLTLIKKISALCHFNLAMYYIDHNP